MSDAEIQELKKELATLRFQHNILAMVVADMNGYDIWIRDDWYRITHHNRPEQFIRRWRRLN
jgi:hypothetical protein